jgi:hypothetical protein
VKPLLLILALTAFVLAGCGRQGDSKPANLFPGAWVGTGSYVNGWSFKSTVIIGPSSNYVCQVVSFSNSGESRTNSLEGTFEIRDGVLTDTVTKLNNTNMSLPTSTPVRIVRVDDQAMVLEWEQKNGTVSPTNNVIFRKVRN